MTRLSRLTALIALMGLLMGIAVLSTHEPVSAEAVVALYAQTNAGSLSGVDIYFAETNAEPSRYDRGSNGLSTFGALVHQMGASLHTLDWRTPFPADMDLLIVPNPGTDYTADAISRLWAYMNAGGRVLLAVNPSADIIPGRERGTLAGNNVLWALMNADFGVAALDNVLVDPAENSDGVFIPHARFTATQLAPAHPITASISGGLDFRMARSLTYDLPLVGGTVTPLVFAPQGYYGEATYAQSVTNNFFNFDIGPDTAPGVLAIAAAYQNDETGSRVVLVGDRDILINGFGFAVSPVGSLGFVFPNDVQFVLQSIAWLTDTAAPTMAFPTPAATATVTITPSPIPPTATPTVAPTTGS
ncbi:MAG: hypothetical protein U0670_04235 [Anaerolineae bacterium]